ncbi:MAG: SRPBCC family protein [Flavobacteriales bacterium]
MIKLPISKLVKPIVLILGLHGFMMSCNTENEDDYTPCPQPTETGEIVTISTDEAHVYTSIIIDATPNQVWEVLTDFETMPNWSTTFQGLEGDIEQDGQINAIFPLPNGELFHYPHALIYSEQEYYGWSDEIVTLPGIVDNHLYKVEYCESQTLFIQTEEFKGNNANLPAIGLANGVLEGYQTFNKELKAEVEKRFN